MAGIPPTSVEARAAEAAGDRKVAPQAQAISGVRRRSFGAAFTDSFGSFLFVVPYLLFFIAFLLGPLVYAFILSLHSWDTLVGDQGFIGLKHYQTFLFDSSDIHFHDFYQALGNTALFTVITVPLLVGIGLILALLVAEAPGQSFWRSLFYIPNVLSVSVVCALWLWIFQTGGIVDTYVHNKNLDWLSNQPWAWMVLIITTLWWTVGGAMVILLAGVVEVPKDYHEAAKIDGANSLQRVLYITVPILRPILAFVSITTMLASVAMVGQSLLITGGGPNQSTQTIFLYIYNQGFSQSNLGTAAAMSFVVGLIMVVASVSALRVFRASET